VQPDETVEHRLTGLLARDNPYIQVNEDAAYRRANARGIMDSSMGIQAGRAAAIEAGLPIASQDAATFGTAAGQNQQYLNQMEMERQGNETSRYGADASLEASTYGTAMGLANNREQRAYEGEQAGLQRTFQDYMRQQGFNESQIEQATQQRFGQQNAAFGAGLSMMAQGQQFRYNAGLAAMENPYIMQNQEAFGGFMNWVQGQAPQYMQDMFNFGLGLGGNP
jgi:hypothetical protein